MEGGSEGEIVDRRDLGVDGFDEIVLDDGDRERPGCRVRATQLVGLSCRSIVEQRHRDSPSRILGLRPT